MFRLADFDNNHMKSVPMWDIRVSSKKSPHFVGDIVNEFKGSFYFYSIKKNVDILR